LLSGFLTGAGVYDIRSRIATLTAESGVTEFGFFGSSLGSFILCNCVGRETPGFANEGRGWSLPRLEAAWAELQWPDFGRLDGCRFVFASSRRDDIAPLGAIAQYLGPMLRAGAEVSVDAMPAISHRTTVIAGLWRAPRLIRMVRFPAGRRSWPDRRRVRLTDGASA
jgi:hypothetical protein